MYHTAGYGVPSTKGNQVFSMLSQSSIMVRRISSGKAQPSEMALPGSVYSSASGSLLDDVLPVGERDDVVAVAVPPADRDLHLLEPESPVPREDDDIGERSGHLLAAAVEQIVEEHRLEFRPHQQPSIGLGGYARVQVHRRLSNRPDHPDQSDRRPPDRKSGHAKQRRHPRTERHYSAADGVRADGRGDATEHPDGQDAIGHCRRAAKGVRPAAGQADDGHLVDAERVRHGAQVIGERGDVVVLVGRRRADAGPVDADQPDVVLLGVDPGLGRDLPSRTGSAVQPEDSAPLRIAELGEPELTIVADRDVAFQLGTSNSEKPLPQCYTDGARPIR